MAQTPEERRAGKAEATKRFFERNPGYRKKWRSANLEKSRLTSKLSARAWRKTHQDYSRDYYRKNKDMIAEKARAVSARDRDKLYARKKNYLATHRDYHLLVAAKHRAKKAGLPCTLTREWIREKISAGTCEVTGIPFVQGKLTAGPWSPSLDRIVGSLGYTPENTRVVVWAFNAAKGHWSDEDVLMLAKAVVSAIEQKRVSA